MIVAAIVSLAVGACAPSLAPPERPPDAAAIASLWREPHDLEERDLLNGPGGDALVPQRVTYQFVEHKTSGRNPGYDVRDPDGRLWSVKLGEEAQSEVTASRILWAIGFHQPAVYYVDRWTLSGPAPSDQSEARFRLEREEEQVVDEWSWYENPFIGSRPFAALVTVNMLLQNWDLKTSNNKVYEVSTAQGTRERRHVLRDLGASLGRARQHWFWHTFGFIRHQQGSKNNLADFEAQGFVKAVEDGFVEFDYRGVNPALAGSVTPEDLRWTCELLSRLSERQWLDAFRAGGYTPEESERYLRSIQAKIQHARSVAGPATRAGAN